MNIIIFIFFLFIIFNNLYQFGIISGSTFFYTVIALPCGFLFLSFINNNIRKYEDSRHVKIMNKLGNILDFIVLLFITTFYHLVLGAFIGVFIGAILGAIISIILELKTVMANQTIESMVIVGGSLGIGVGFLATISAMIHKDQYENKNTIKLSSENGGSGAENGNNGDGGGDGGGCGGGG